jgi:serine/threonine protein kinase
MAPEQAQGRVRHLTTAADVYSLGAILNQMLTGRPPFQAETPLEVMRKAVEEEPARPSAIRKHNDRDLHYVPALMRAYNTEEKVMDTLQAMEEHGINAILADPRKKPMDIFARYWKERGGKIQWIAEGHPEVDDWQTNLKQSIDFGAAAVYVQGVKSDRFYKDGRLELLGKCVQFVKSQGVPAGIGAHKLDVIRAAEKNNYGAEFYVKTLHHTNYWSCRRPDQQADVIDNPADNYWDTQPEETIRLMQEVQKPWIAFKVLAAGAIRPESGFKYAFENGADFICVGMFDFQVEQNVALVKGVLQQTQNRQREWMG